MDEQELIHHYFAGLGPKRPDVLLGIGDDGAIVCPPAEQQLVLTTDTMAEGVHFPAELRADAVGYRSVAVNFSDLAAMGASPSWVLLALTIPEVEPHWLEAFADGVRRILLAYEASLIGGNVTRGPLSITVTAVGTVTADEALTRSTAKPGDELFVTGSLGGGKAGLRALLDGEVVDGPSAKGFAWPRARVQVARALTRWVNAAMDISDGLIGDLGKLLEASGGLGARIDLDAVPCATGATLEDALGPSDDYELLFTVPVKHASRLPSLGIDCKLSRIGCVTATPGIFAEDRLLEPIAFGYRHF